MHSLHFLGFFLIVCVFKAIEFDGSLFSFLSDFTKLMTGTGIGALFFWQTYFTSSYDVLKLLSLMTELVS